jgi:hypothetical protein
VQRAARLSSRAKEPRGRTSRTEENRATPKPRSPSQRSGVDAGNRWKPGLLERIANLEMMKRRNNCPWHSGSSHTLLSRQEQPPESTQRLPVPRGAGRPTQWPRPLSSAPLCHRPAPTATHFLAFDCQPLAFLSALSLAAFSASSIFLMYLAGSLSKSFLQFLQQSFTSWPS